MAEETISSEQAATPEPAAASDTVDVAGQSEGQAVEFESLFDEGVSDAELMGEEEQTEKPSEAKEEPAPSPPKDVKESEKEPETPKEEEPQADEGQQDKPPKGFVPIQALHQERTQRQVMAQQLQQLQAQLDAAKTAKPETDKPEADGEFKVLSESEFNELLEEDPVEAIKYDRKLRSWETQQAEKANAAKAEQSIIDRSISMMVEAVPGLYDQENDTNEQLTNFAAEHGFTDLDGLSIVTDPRTKVIPVNGGKPQLLGETAAHFVTLLSNLFQTTKNGDKAKDSTLKAEVTKELLSKLKQSPAGQHVSLGDIPGGDTIDVTAGPMTEAQYAKMSAEDKRRYLGG